MWHYILTGEFFDFPRAAFELTDKVSTIEMVFVDALVETHEGTIIYTGILVDYELNKESGLDFITLKRVKRRFLVGEKNEKSENKKEDQYYEIPGHILVIRNDQLININFTYYKLKAENEMYSIELVSWLLKNIAANRYYNRRTLCDDYLGYSLHLLTALRDIQDLIEKNVLRKEAAGGRSTNYELLRL